MSELSTSSSQAELVAPLERFSRGDVDQAGGKAANLGELVRARFPVPPGLAVTTAAYDRFVADNGLRETIALALPEARGTGAAIRAAFESASIPRDVEAEILAAYRRLGEGPVAVRSSATAEDLPEAAFAGQQDTYLNVVGPEAVLAAVRRCWASLWTDRAIAYRAQQGVDQEGVKLAIVVQRMVAAEAAGVMFTANPVTGARDEIVIDSNPGLGEAVVAGLVTPDHVVVERRRRGWRIVERRAGRREVIVQARAGGGTEEIQGPGAAEGPALPDRVVLRLARLGTAIERHFGRPQDVEWAWAAGEPFILQARPITALPSPVPRLNKVQRMVAGNFWEMLRIRPYPLDLDTWIPALGGALEPVFGLMGLDWSFRRTLETEDGVVVRFKPELPRPTWRTLLAPPRMAAHILRHDPLLWQSDPLLAQVEAIARDQAAQDPKALSWEGLLEAVHEAGQIPFLAGGQVRRRYFPGAAFAALRLRLLLGLLGRSDQFGTLLSGAANMTLEANHALEQLAEQVRSEPGLAATFARHEPQELWSILAEQPGGHMFLAELRAFLDRYGHRETMISTALQPTWKDAPELVLGIVKGSAAHPPQRQGDEAAWQVARDALLQHRLLRFAPLRSAFLDILAKARTVLHIREDTHFYSTLSLPLLRRTLLELGRRLVTAGVLDAPEDVFHLRLAEVEQVGGRLPPPPGLAAELRAAASRRKARRAGLEGTPLVDPRLFAQSVPEGEELLRGMPGSPGVAEGPARLVQDASQFDRLIAGDVLVAPYTNPSWTPLFQRAAAVVVDSGSLASHAAIVAREYGIPAVMNTITGTQTLRDGQRLRVDGSQGKVYGAPSQAEGHEGQKGHRE
ncbi:MAG TPA: PEP/pyruvate-binding domain-containing protein [Anaerolineae bacterium]|nr:PEP/pyruvate-binding domain-containing protein [Anaerolineae bacterium]